MYVIQFQSMAHHAIHEQGTAHITFDPLAPYVGLIAVHSAHITQISAAQFWRAFTRGGAKRRPHGIKHAESGRPDNVFRRSVQGKLTGESGQLFKRVHGFPPGAYQISSELYFSR